MLASIFSIGTLESLSAVTLKSIFNAGTFGVGSVLAAFGVALVLGLVIATLYRKHSTSQGFPVVLAIMPMLIAAVIMIVNGNIGASVAVLGAFSLVRFRSATGSAMEIGFLFFAMAVGLSIGMGFLTLAVLIAIIVGIVFYLLDKTGFGRRETMDRLLKITIPEDLDFDGIFDDLFEKYTSHATLDRVKTTNMGTMYQLSYTIGMKDMAQQKAFIDELRCRNGNLTIMIGPVKKAKNEL